MKIAHITSSTFPSKEANAVQVAAMASALSLQADVLLIGNRGDGATDAEIRTMFDIPAAVQFALDLDRSPGWLNTLRYVHRLRHLIRGSDVELAYGRDPFGLLGARSVGVKCLYEIHHPPATRARRAVEGVLFRARHVGLVFITQALEDWYCSEFPMVADMHTVVAPDGADLEDDDEDHERTAGPPRIGYFGSLNVGKGMELITEIAPRLERTEIHVFGGQQDQIDLWRSRQQSDNVVFHGWRPHSVVGAAMRDMDVLLAPYQRVSHGAGGDVDISTFMSPLKIFEYMASGRPLVASDLPVLREVLTEGVTALLRAPEDTDGWVRGVTMLLEDDALSTDLACRARLLAETFTWGTRSDSVLRLAERI